MKNINRIILILSAICLICAITASSGASAAADNVYVLGDADSNGAVDVRDAAAVQRHSVRLTSFNTVQLKAADVNSDNRVNIHDATLIQKHISDTKKIYPIGEQFTLPTQQQPTTKNYELPFIPI